MPVTEKKMMEIDSIRLRFAQVLRLNRQPATVPKTEVGADDDSAYSSGNSGQSSPDESPVSRSDSPSPTADQPASISPNRPQNPFRVRSMSESGNSPLKGILKRRPVMRFLSQCEEEISPPISNTRNSQSPSLGSTDINSSNESESEDDGLRERSQSSSSKKSVRFSDRVQENVFRPNSSILGQRKKNQKKQQRKRKRTFSSDSQTGGSENENENEHDNENENEEIDSEQLEDEVVEEEKQEVVEKEKVEKENVETSRGQKKKAQPKPVVLDDKRYNGFVVGEKKREKHRRHSSGDSALGDDEAEGDVFVKPVCQVGKKGKRRTVSCGDPKDSGIDE